MTDCAVSMENLCMTTAIHSGSDDSKVAVILPVYRTAAYLPKCLESLLQQKHQNFVVFAVNDGSPDGSELILEKYARRDDRIKIIRQVNGGLSSARNTALDIVEQRGDFDYVAYVDSDDYVAPEYLSSMLSFAKAQTSDLVVCGYKSFNDKVEPWSLPFYSGTQLDKEDFISLVFGVDEFNVNGKGGMVWKFLIAADTARGLRFERDRSVLEDEPYCFKLVKAAKKIAYLKEPLYYYRSSDGSLSKAKDFGSKIIKARSVCLAEARDLSPYIYNLTLSKLVNVLLRELKKGRPLPENFRLADYENDMRQGLKSGLISKRRFAAYQLFLRLPRLSKLYVLLWKSTRPFSRGKWRSYFGIKKHG